MINVFWYDHNWWGYAGMGIGMVVFWALIVAGIVALVMYLSRDRHASPEQILAARFARGEITEAEYRDRMAVLRDPTQKR